MVDERIGRTDEQIRILDFSPKNSGSTRNVVHETHDSWLLLSGAGTRVSLALIRLV